MIKWLLQIQFGVCECVRCACVCPDLSGHNLYSCAWISKQFGTVVILGE